MVCFSQDLGIDCFRELRRRQRHRGSPMTAPKRKRLRYRRWMFCYPVRRSARGRPSSRSMARPS